MFKLRDYQIDLTEKCEDIFSYPKHNYITKTASLQKWVNKYDGQCKHCSIGNRRQNQLFHCAIIKHFFNVPWRIMIQKTRSSKTFTIFTSFLQKFGAFSFKYHFLFHFLIDSFFHISTHIYASFPHIIFHIKRISLCCFAFFSKNIPLKIKIYKRNTSHDARRATRKDYQAKSHFVLNYFSTFKH